MKVLLTLTDQSFFATKSIGIFNVSVGLARGLMKAEGVSELHLLGNSECASALGDLPPHVHLHLADKAVPTRFGRVWWDQVGVQRAIRRLAPDWAILPKGFPPYFPRLGRTKLACYLHDLNWEYYRGAQAKVGAAADSPFPPHQLAYFSRLGLRALEVSDLVLTSTQFNRSRFEHYRPKCRCAVVGIGFDEPAQLAPAVRGRDIVAYVSPYPHKLTHLAIPRLQRWIEQRADAADIRIHLLGQLPSGCVLPQSPGQWVNHTRLPWGELQQLLREQCRVSVYFSDYEGFGMPPVESLRLGIACAASDLPPIRENIPPRYLFNNDDEAGFVRTLNALYEQSKVADCPNYPSWAEVAQRAINQMKTII